MFKHRIVLGALVMFVCTRASLPQKTTDYARLADSLAGLSPARELRTAIKRGDLRAIGVCGWACMPVGLDSRDYSIVDVRNLNTIEATSDVPPNRDAQRLNKAADMYATAYNRLLVAYLRDHRTP